jgi:cytochrome d ubiquinol oxidase subunit II
MYYEILRVLWWAVLGVLLIGIAVMDGLDLGAAILLPFVGRSNVERRVVINTVGPVWEGNQVWLILGGGAIFAAWPPIYALAFSGFYFAMLLLLVALILRPVGFKFRSKIDDPTWRTVWDAALFVGGLVPALVFGVAFGNVLQGVPFHFDDTLRVSYDGGFFALFNPFALLAGLTSVAMVTLHGATWLGCKTTGAVQARARQIGVWAGLVTVVLFAIGGVWAASLNGYVLGHFGGMDGPSNPLAKEVTRQAGALMSNYGAYPWMMIAPVLAVVAAFAAVALLRSGRASITAWVASALAIAGIIGTAGLSLFPFMLPNSANPAMSMIVWDSSSSQLTLAIMTGVTVIFLPIVLVYTAWVYHVLRGPVTEREVLGDSRGHY